MSRIDYISGFTGAPLFRQMIIDLATLGITTNVGTVLASVLMHESNDGNSNVAKTCNNYGGIIFVNQPGATRCSRAQPGAEGGAGYAAYPNLKTFLKDFVRVMKLNRGGRGAPLSALKRVKLYNDRGGAYSVDVLDVPEMVARMRANGYFSDSADNYLAAVQSKFRQYAEAKLKEIYQVQQDNRMQSAEGKRFGPDVPFLQAVETALKEDIVEPAQQAFGTAGKYLLWGGVGLAALIILTRR